ncbi:MmgE/PrpD family protein [Amycolatopsis carbonis]|uniref:MmgE/PrpD family protein n=1 Tax=Amycolatopsis carbonis TaxID=715471 RepID=A0A9Y2I8A5_9PSEU|nr:MmgE/PrpD family protein [Amycolatopsis sp. 2-15]WIX75635.1 MmgE/PrpD family protein [Amycolatopsis sp. 2-15]
MAAPVLDVERNTITRRISEYLFGLRYDDLSDGVAEIVKIFTLEAIGHMVLAHAQPVSRMLVGYARELGAKREAQIFGGGFKTSVAEAAYVNGSLAHADELESYGTVPGSGLVPPIVAGLTVGDYKNSSGRDYLTAVVAGIEMQGRLGMSGIGACDRGFMGISLVGPAAAAVTGGRLLGLDVDQLQNALGAALPLGNGSTRGCGSMAHVHEAGVPIRSGVFAAQMAGRGFTSCVDFLDGAHSWGVQYAGVDGARPYDEAKLLEGLGERFFVQTVGIAPKRYGSCGLTHQTIYGTIELMRENDIGPDDIAHVELIVPPWADRIAPYREPVSGEQAKFSIRQGVAGLLVGGIPELPYTDAFDDQAARDPRYVEARKRVTVTVTEGESVRGFADQTVKATLADGRVITKVVGSLEDTSYTLDERIAMFKNTAQRLGGSKADRIVDIVMDLENHTIGEIAALTS